MTSVNNNTYQYSNHHSPTILFFFQNPSQSVAVKVVTKKGLQKASEILVKEIKILRELTALHHTNLVAMHDCMDSTSYVYVVMEVSPYMIQKLIIILFFAYEDVILLSINNSSYLKRNLLLHNKSSLKWQCAITVLQSPATHGDYYDKPF